MDNPIYVARPSLPPIDEYMEYLTDIWETHGLTNMGKYHMIFQKKLAEKFNLEYIMLFCNGHMALELALQAMNLHGEVITTPFTFASTTHAIVRNGLTPVFCDIKESDCTIDEEKIESLITTKTSAILPVHVYGYPCDLYKIEWIAKKNNLKVIYDAAHAFGEYIGEKALCDFGDASMLSFHATKAFNTIEGGAIVGHDYDFMLRLYKLLNFGILNEDDVLYVGSNAKMNEFEAAMGLANLKHFDENVEKRKKLYELYRQKLTGIHGISFLKNPPNNIKFNYTYCPIIVNEAVCGKSRDDLALYLRERNIFARKYFYPLTSEFECYKTYNFMSDTPVASKMSKSVLTLPLYADLDVNIVDKICKTIINWTQE